MPACSRRSSARASRPPSRDRSYSSECDRSRRRASKRQVEHAAGDEFAALDRAEGDDRAAARRIGGAFRRCVAAQKNRLAAAQAARERAVDGDLRHLAEAGFDAAQRGAEIGVGRRQGGERHGIVFVERPDAGTPQRGDMAEATERAAQIAGDRAHIGALAAPRFEHGAVAVGGYEVEGMNGDGPCRQFELLAVARPVVGARAIDLDRGKGRRPLLDRPGEMRQQRRDGGRRGAPVRSRNDRAFGVVAVGLRAPGHLEPIGLFAVLHVGDGFRRLAEGDGKDAGGDRVERAGMAGLLAVEETLQLRDGIGRGYPDRLVEDDPAVDLGARRTALAGRARLIRREVGGSGLDRVNHRRIRLRRHRRRHPASAGRP